MPVPAPIGITATIPNCAVLYLFELNGLHYYETVDCASGSTGWGVSERKITNPSGCNGGTCDLGSIVDPTFQLFASLEALLSRLRGTDDTGALSNAAASAAFDEAVLRLIQSLAAEALAARFPDTSPKKRRAQREADAVVARADAQQRRKDVGTWISNNVNQLDARSALHQRYWLQATEEIRRVILNPGGGTGKQLFAKDQFLSTVETIGAGPITNVLTVHDPGAVPNIAEPAFGPNNLPYVKAKRKGNPNLGDNDVYFRLMNVTLYDGEVLNIGMQIEEETLRDAGIGLNNINQLATFIDRHEHIHLINVKVGPTDTQYFVYSPNSFRIREDFV